MIDNDFCLFEEINSTQNFIMSKIINMFMPHALPKSTEMKRIKTQINTTNTD